jgi:hypothetical protein
LATFQVSEGALSLPGLLVEYLITGACAILWMWVLFAAIAPEQVLDLEDFDAAHATFVVPLAYVVGMVIDYVGRLLATGLRRLIADPVNKKIGPSLLSVIPRRWRRTRKLFAGEHLPRKSLMNQAEILECSVELGKQYEMRSSRDRIARGVFANVAIASCVGAFFRADMPNGFALIWGKLTSVAVLLTFAAWFRFHRLTRRFRHAASLALRDRKATKPASQFLPGQV